MPVTGKQELEASIDLFLDEFQKRLSSTISRQTVMECVRRAARFDGALAFTQPGHSGYAWSRRKVTLALACRLGDTVHVRLRCSTSVRNNGVTPGIWPELRRYPNGDLMAKFQRWAAADDVIRVDAALVNALALACATVDVTEGSISHSSERRYASAAFFSKMPDAEKKTSIQGRYRPHVLAGLSDPSFEVRQLARDAIEQAAQALRFLEEAARSDRAERHALVEDAARPLDDAGRHVLDGWMRLETELRLALLRHPVLADVESLAVTRALSRLLDESQQDPPRRVTEVEMHRLLGFGYLPWVVRLLHREELPIAVASNVIRNYRPTKMGWYHQERADAERAQLDAFSRRPDLMAEDLELLADRAGNLSDKAVLRLIAHPGCPPTMWANFAQKKSDLALQHPALPAEMVVTLSGSSDPKLRAAAAAHPHMPPERWALLVRAGCSPDLCSLVEHPVLTFEDVKVLWDTGLPWDRQIVLRQSAVSDGWIMESYYDKECLHSSASDVDFLAAIENPSLSRFAFDVLRKTANGWVNEDDSYDESCGVEFTEKEGAERARVRAMVKAHPAYRPRRSWTWALSETSEGARMVGYLCCCPDENPTNPDEYQPNQKQSYTWRLHDAHRALLRFFTGTQKEASHELVVALGLRLNRKSLKVSGFDLTGPQPVFIGRD